MAENKSKVDDDDEIIQIPDLDEEIETSQSEDFEEIPANDVDSQETEDEKTEQEPQVIEKESVVEKVVVKTSNDKSDEESKNKLESEDVKTPEKDAAKSEPDESISEKPNRKLSKKLLLIIGILLIIAAAITYYLLIIKDSNKPANNIESISNAITEKPATDEKVEEIDGNTFLEAPELISGVSFYKDLTYYGTDPDCDMSDPATVCPAAIKPEDIKYYKIGATKDGKRIIVAYYGGIGLEVSAVSNIGIENEPGKYMVLAKMDENLARMIKEAGYLDNFKKGLADGTTLNTTSIIKELQYEQEPEVGSQELKAPYEWYFGNFMAAGPRYIRTSFDGQTKEYVNTKIGTVGNTDFYKLEVKEEQNYKIIEIYAVKYGMFSLSYDLNDDFSDENTAPKINWTSGSSDGAKYFSAGQGCGSSGYIVAKVEDSDLVQVGTSEDGTQVYRLANTHPLAIELFEKDYVKGESLENAALKNLTIDQLNEKHGYFLVKNGDGDYVVYLRNDMFIRGGCAKPVVYLYPEKMTSVNVSVGADVTISDPYYPKDGWKNVLASPNGSLLYHGNLYESLFWEGYGHGSYPEITSGTVVKRSLATATIRQQLLQQGLIDNEINDFIEYWEPKLPDTPYVRLSWLTPAEINSLAPLYISPKPQTIIRVFLDFEGLNQPKRIAPQKLQSQNRNGFTVTEWGGLLNQPFEKNN